MPFKVFVINGTIFFEPSLHERTSYVVVVNPSLVASVVGWVNVNTLDTVRIAREQCFESTQVIAVNDKVISGTDWVARAAFRQFQVGGSER